MAAGVSDASFPESPGIVSDAPEDFPRRWRASILNTAVGPRLLIEDSRPTGKAITSGLYLDLPVQLSRYHEATLYVRETGLSSRVEYLRGTADHVDDLIAQLATLRVHRLQTLRPIELWDGPEWPVARSEVAS